MRNKNMNIRNILIFLHFCLTKISASHEIQRFMSKLSEIVKDVM